MMCTMLYQMVRRRAVHLQVISRLLEAIIRACLHIVDLTTSHTVTISSLSVTTVRVCDEGSKVFL